MTVTQRHILLFLTVCILLLQIVIGTVQYANNVLTQPSEPVTNIYGEVIPGAKDARVAVLPDYVIALLVPPCCLLGMVAFMKAEPKFATAFRTWLVLAALAPFFCLWTSTVSISEWAVVSKITLLGCLIDSGLLAFLLMWGALTLLQSIWKHEKVDSAL